MIQTTDPSDWETYQFSRIPDGPKNVPEVYRQMKTISYPSASSFIDRRGEYVSIPQRESGNKMVDYFDPAYAKCLWDFRHGNILIGEMKPNTDVSQATLYVRDVDKTGANRLLDTWHAVSNLESEYHPGRGKAYSVWNLQMKVECAKLTQRVRHGIKFADRAYLRVGERRRLKVLHQGDEYFDQPFELVVDQPYDVELMKQAAHFLRDVTQDDHSAKNLARMFATPLLEEYKHLTYILFGDGGNGKGLLLNTLSHSYPDFAKSIDSQRILGGRRASGGFDTQQETGKLIGALWAFDEDADSISIDQLTYLKKISTGDPVTARRIGENAVSVRPRCTFIIATNNPVVTTLTAASARRYVYVRMKDGRKPEDFEDLIDFIDEYGADPFIMLSCDLWAREGDRPFTDVSIGSADDVTELEQDIIDEVCANGYARSSKLADLSRAGQRDTLAKLGLMRMGKKWVPALNGSLRVIGVKDEQHFAPYRAAWKRNQEELEKQIIRPRPKPLELSDGFPLPTELGFAADYVAADSKKVARNWKRQVEAETIDTSVPPQSPAYAVVPAPGFAIIDMDMGKGEKDPDGWTLLQSKLGGYGTPGFPATYLVGTPSGGSHAYYALPDQLKGKLKNSVHPDGIPIDIRTERRGYVVGAGSKTDAGEYSLLDLPDGNIPVMPLQMVAWLETHGYVEGIGISTSMAPSPIVVNPKAMPTSLEEIMRPPSESSTGEPVMTPVPEGQRNDKLHAWAYGRMLHYPDEEQKILSDLFQRGHASGLKDDELSTIWRSIKNQLGRA